MRTIFARNILRLHAAKIGAVNDKTQKILSLTIKVPVHGCPRLDKGSYP